MACYKCGKDADHTTRPATIRVEFKHNDGSYFIIMSVFPPDMEFVCRECMPELLEIAAVKVKEELDRQYSENA